MDALGSAEHTLGTPALYDSNKTTCKMRLITWRELNQSAIVLDTRAVLLSHLRVIVKVTCFVSICFSFSSFFFPRIHNKFVETSVLALPCLSNS